MSRTCADMGGNCLVFTDEQKQHIRVVKHEGQAFYCANDIATCMGYSAPYKAVMRAPVEKITLPVPWVSGRRKGITKAVCLRKAEVLKFVQRMETTEDFRSWLLEEVIPQAEATVVAPQPMLEAPGAVNGVAVRETIVQMLDQIIVSAAVLKSQITKGA